MLILDPSSRISARNAYVHPFVGGIVSDYENFECLDENEGKFSQAVKMEEEKSW